MTSALFRSRSLIANRRSRFYRPLVESLESRNLLAFNLTISLANTAKVDTVTAAGTTTFTAAANGANVSVADIDNALRAGNDVVVTSGTDGTEAGNIATSGFTSRLFSNDPGKTLAIITGSGSQLVGNIVLPGLQLRSKGTLLVQANNQVTLENVSIAETMTISSTKGSISMPAGGNLQAGELTLTAQDGIGTADQPLPVSVDSLTTNTTSGNGDQFINESSLDGLTALNLNAGTGDVTLNVQLGAVADTDAAIDVTADIATIVLFAESVQDFGAAANPIGTSVNVLNVSTDFGTGDQFITELQGLTGLQLRASIFGNVTLNVAAGGVLDSDLDSEFEPDILAQSATITLGGTLNNFGAIGAGNSIRTNVDSLSVDTSAGAGLGDQFIDEENGLTALNLKTGGGNVTLRLVTGGIADSDPDTDVFANISTIKLLDATRQNFGLPGNPIRTSATGLIVETRNGGGSQFISETGSLLGMSLDAGAGNVTLAAPGGILNIGGAQIIAAAANLTGDEGSFGSPSDPISLDVDSLSFTSNQSAAFAETDSVIVTRLDADTKNITLVSGIFNLAAGDALGDNSTLIVNSPAVVSPTTSLETVGALSGSGTVDFRSDGSSRSLSVGGNNSSTTFSGNLIGNNVSSGLIRGALLKAGSGILTLSGTNTFTGGYVVQAGTLLVNGTIAESTRDVFVNRDCVLGGTGTINHDVNISNGGRLAPGTSTGDLSTSNLEFHPGSAFDIEITSDTPGELDQVKVTGTVVIDTSGAGVVLNVTGAGTINLLNGEQPVIIINDGTDAVTGTFKDLSEGANLGSNFLGSGLTAKITYVGGTGNDVALVLSPGNLFPWHNEAKRLDVNGGDDNAPDDHIVAGDALQVINYLNAFGSGAVPASAVLGLPFGFLDTDGNNFVTAGDALDVINFLNAGLGARVGGRSEVRIQNSEFRMRNVSQGQRERLIRRS